MTNTFLKRKYTETRTEIENAIQEKDAWKATVLVDVTIDYKPLLVVSLLNPILNLHLHNYLFFCRLRVL